MADTSTQVGRGRGRTVYARLGASEARGTARADQQIELPLIYAGSTPGVVEQETTAGSTMAKGPRSLPGCALLSPESPPVKKDAPVCWTPESPASQAGCPLSPGRTSEKRRVSWKTFPADRTRENLFKSRSQVQLLTDTRRTRLCIRRRCGCHAAGCLFAESRPESGQ
jgi:hypothetical protein